MLDSVSFALIAFDNYLSCFSRLPFLPIRKQYPFSAAKTLINLSLSIIVNSDAKCPCVALLVDHGVKLDRLRRTGFDSHSKGLATSV